MKFNDDCSGLLLPLFYKSLPSLGHREGSRLIEGSRNMQLELHKHQRYRVKRRQRPREFEKPVYDRRI